MLDAIAFERRKELLGEGHRWFDVKRTSRNLVRTDCPAPALDCALAPADREWVWPIPQGEIDANANINNQQTSGY
ncbi:RagB/SusD family nutrient uptake outer membrane protein [Pontibacter locisalis]|uniref:RagB/SusD family nutrient uptake outer membrane protein n=1 Tax=Pontibacter locisalis TaxID=1719035 RepID=A0ABW5IPE6_9BACT